MINDISISIGNIPLEMTVLSLVIMIVELKFNGLVNKLVELP